MMSAVVAPGEDCDLQDQAAFGLQVGLHRDERFQRLADLGTASDDLAGACHVGRFGIETAQSPIEIAAADAVLKVPRGAFNLGAVKGFVHGFRLRSSLRWRGRPAGATGTGNEFSAGEVRSHWQVS